MLAQRNGNPSRLRNTGCRLNARAIQIGCGTRCRRNAQGVLRFGPPLEFVASTQLAVLAAAPVIATELSRVEIVPALAGYA